MAYRRKGDMACCRSRQNLNHHYSNEARREAEVKRLIDYVPSRANKFSGQFQEYNGRHDD